MDHDDGVEVGLVEIGGGVTINLSGGGYVVVFDSGFGDGRVEFGEVEAEGSERFVE